MNTQLISELKTITGAGVLEFKAALEASQWNLDNAVLYIRKNSKHVVEAKAHRQTSNGRIFIKHTPESVLIAKILCETDFVANCEAFEKYGTAVLNNLQQQTEANMELTFERNEKLREGIIASTKENVLDESQGQYYVVEGSVLGVYLHSNHKTAAIVQITGDNRDLANDIAMHVVASKTDYVRRSDVPEALVIQEKDVAKAKALASNKPEKFHEKIIDGMLNKFYQRICLLEQPFVKDTSKTIGELLTQHTATVEFIDRYEI